MVWREKENAVIPHRQSLSILDKSAGNKAGREE